MDPDYNVLDNATIPLIGTSTTRHGSGQCINVLFGFLTCFAVIFTVISSIVLGKNSKRGLNISFGMIVGIIFLSHMFLIIWYRQGDLDGRFKVLIYVNAFYIIALCVIANIYFFES